MILFNQHLIRGHLQADPECLFMNKVCVLAPVQMGSPVVRTVLSLPRALVQSLVRDLRFHMPLSQKKKIKDKSPY